MKKAIPCLLAIAVLSTISLSTQAAELSSGLHFVLNGGITGGGDKIGTAHYTNGDTQSVEAGGLVQLGGGLLWQAATLPIALEFTLNYHVDDVSASNGNMKFERIPLETIVYYTGEPRWRFGAGIRYIQSAQYTSHIDGGADNTINFKDTIGALIQVGYGITPHTWVNVRLVSEKYQPNTYINNGTTYDVSNQSSFDGSHIGVNFSYVF